MDEPKSDINTSNNSLDIPDRAPLDGAAPYTNSGSIDGNVQQPEGSKEKRGIRQRWQEFWKADTDRHVELILAAAITFFALCQLVVTILNNRSTSQQTTQLLVAADRVDDASESFSRSASGINGGVGDAVGKLNAQAKETGNLKGVEAQQLEFQQLSISAIYGATLVIQNVSIRRHVSSDTVGVNVSFCNLGKVSPDSVSYALKVAFVPPSKSAQNFKPDDFKQYPTAAVRPMAECSGNTPFVDSSDITSDIKIDRSASKVYAWGEIRSHSLKVNGAPQTFCYTLPVMGATGLEQGGHSYPSPNLDVRGFDLSVLNSCAS